MSFSEAIAWLKKGKAVYRAAWGANTFLQLQTPDASSRMTQPYLYIEKAGTRVPWVAPHADLLASDWAYSA